jgi:hypothetical protein
MIYFLILVPGFLIIGPLVFGALYAIIVREPWEKKEHWWEYRKKSR